MLREIGAHDLAEFLQHEKLADDRRRAYRGEFDPHSTIAACRQHDRAEATLVTELAESYPGDPSVVVTLLLNRVMLAAGEAVFLGPGNLHAYLRGFGVEVMGNSDNVVRGGMTVKHVDVEELLAVLDFEPLRPTRSCERTEVEPGRWRYETPNTPFVMSQIELGDDDTTSHHGARAANCCCGSSGAATRRMPLPGPRRQHRPRPARHGLPRPRAAEPVSEPRWWPGLAGG